MASIKKRDTKPELALRKALWSAGVRGWRCHDRRLAGSPDLAFSRWRVAVMVDGVFWHGHPDHLPGPNHSRYWHEKIARNVARDDAVTAQLQHEGWTVVRIWDLDVLGRTSDAVDEVKAALIERGWPEP